MAEPLKNNFDPRPLYPEPSPTVGAGPVAVDATLPSEYAPTSLNGFAEPGDYEEQEPGIVDRARDAAQAAGERLQVVAGRARRQAGEIAGRAADLAGDAGERLGDLKDRATEQASHLRDEWNERMPVWRARARHSVEDARLRANQTTQRYPLQTIAAAAALGFIVGIGLRVWRSNRG